MLADHLGIALDTTKYLNVFRPLTFLSLFCCCFVVVVVVIV